MQIVIDISEEEYEVIVNSEDCGLHTLTRAIANGTPLPKGHGRLIDADELKKIIQENDVLYMRGFNVRLCDINNAPTVLEGGGGK